MNLGKLLIVVVNRVIDYLPYGGGLAQRVINIQDSLNETKKYYLTLAHFAREKNLTEINTEVENIGKEIISWQKGLDQLKGNDIIKVVKIKTLDRDKFILAEKITDHIIRVAETISDPELKRQVKAKLAAVEDIIMTRCR